MKYGRRIYEVSDGLLAAPTAAYEEATGTPRSVPAADPGFEAQTAGSAMD